MMRSIWVAMVDEHVCWWWANNVGWILGCDGLNYLQEAVFIEWEEVYCEIDSVALNWMKNRCKACVVNWLMVESFKVSFSEWFAYSKIDSQGRW